MIVFDLLCRGGHRFEGWFSSSQEFVAQNAKGLVSCPACGLQGVERIPSATRFNAGVPEKPRHEEGADPRKEQDPFAIAQLLYSRMLDEMLARSEDVGREFPAEARRIFYRECPERPIRGQATPEEHESLLEEGIPVLRLPIPAPDRMS